MAKLALIRIFGKLAFAFAVLLIFKNWTSGFDWWVSSFYPFLQNVRVWVFDYIPFSAGDIIYVFLGIILVVGLLVSLYPILFINKYMEKAFVRLGVFALVLVSAIISMYTYFLVGWGGHYYREPIGKSWGLDEDTARVDVLEFETRIIARINALQPFYKSYELDKVNTIAVSNYTTLSDCKFTFRGYAVKKSLFGSYVDKMGIEGYFNPFTGEGQISKNLPKSILPFVLTHEMAHKAGIAREGDANLVAYALCSISPDSSFRYAANLDLLTYVHRRLFWKDSNVAKNTMASLNPYTRHQLDTLKKYFELSENELSDAGREMFDEYLKLQQQKEGIKSYGNIVKDAWRLELRRKRLGVEKVRLY